MRTVKEQQRKRRHARIRARVTGDEKRPRLSVFRSNKYIYAQIINDEKGVTLASASDYAIKQEGKKWSKLDRAKAVGTALAEFAKEKKISKVVFDRGGFLYTGRVKALSEGAREGGLQF